HRLVLGVRGRRLVLGRRPPRPELAVAEPDEGAPRAEPAAGGRPIGIGGFGGRHRWGSARGLRGHRTSRFGAGRHPFLVTIAMPRGATSISTTVHPSFTFRQAPRHRTFVGCARTNRFRSGSGDSRTGTTPGGHLAFTVSSALHAGGGRRGPRTR